jgi:hypothetical protein
MRYFLCTFDNFSLGIPEDSVAAIMIYSEPVSEVVHRGEGEDVFFSLPHFFALGDTTIRHGIVLKSLNREEDENHEGPRNVLLVRSVEREMTITPEDIYPLPELLLAPGKFPFFTGISFADSVMIALIDPALLIARILRDTEGGAEA